VGNVPAAFPLGHAEQVQLEYALHYFSLADYIFILVHLMQNP
jgi:hypothetical protein